MTFGGGDFLCQLLLFPVKVKDQDFLLSSFSRSMTNGTHVLLTSKTTARDPHWAYAVHLDALILGPGEELLVDLFQRVVHSNRQPIQS